MTRPIVQLGDPVLRQSARTLTPAEVRSADIRRLIEVMRATMRKAPGVGLAAPQIGVDLRIAVIEDSSEYLADLDDEELAQRERKPVPFHVVVNPVVEVTAPALLHFFEGCLSLSGFVGVVGRARGVRVRALDHQGEPVVIDATGWYARILQHETDHLNGIVYVDRMDTRTFMSSEQYSRHWADFPIEAVRKALAMAP